MSMEVLATIFKHHSYDVSLFSFAKLRKKNMTARRMAFSIGTEKLQAFRMAMNQNIQTLGRNVRKYVQK